MKKLFSKIFSKKKKQRPTLLDIQEGQHVQLKGSSPPYPLGALPSKQDTRDYTVAMFTPVQESFEDEFIFSHLPDIYNQSWTSMCVAFAVAGLKEAQEYKERGVKVRYSPAFIYGNRGPDDYKGEGMYPREALKRLVTEGVCTFETFSLINNYPNCADWFKDPSSNWYIKATTEAKPQKIKSYVRANTDNELRTMLKTMGPAIIVIAVYPSFYVIGNDGIVPDVGNETIDGYHGMLVVGWTKINGKLYWVVHNSWGTNWGKKGVCYIPFGYKGITETWGVTDFTPDTVDKELLYPMQVMPPGRTVLGFRDIYEAIGGSVTWGRGLDNKIWARAVIPPTDKTYVIETREGSSTMKISSS